MKTVHHLINQDNLEQFKPIFYKLKMLNLYNKNGILKEIYDNPQTYCEQEARLSIGYYRNKPVSVLFISKDNYFGWDYHYPGIKKTYGLICLYTNSDYRNKGYAKKLFDEFDSSFSVSSICASYKAKSVMQSKPKNEKVFFNDEM